jgi:quercetin dioxygenase-like cupin family protein
MQHFLPLDHGVAYSIVEGGTRAVPFDRAPHANVFVQSIGYTGEDYRAGWWSQDFVEVPIGATLFGYIAEGSGSVLIPHLGTFRVVEGCYFALPPESALFAPVAIRALLIGISGYSAPFQLGGPIEDEGRLRYIDGCTDSLIIPPVRKGDPCLNHLHFPVGINQTRHTHPSVRLGITVRGRGECVTPDEVLPLEAGKLWCIPTGGQHSFRTTHETLDVIAFHPDSDFGAEDEFHPMLNRTLIGGISASPRVRAMEAERAHLVSAGVKSGMTEQAAAEHAERVLAGRS